ncbi:arylsulfatase [Glutamicibacter arilaitensis]|uniref:sulfatase family protein n=1 Tax=Glutamicibacter arilaitensis TaxID=256701 RepID=UPI003850E528
MFQPVSKKSSRPNVLLVLADDLGQGDISCFNLQSGWKTPYIDQLAEQGMRMFDSHSTSSLCTPSRYGLLTGRYNWRSRLKRTVLPGDSESLIEKDRLTLARFLSGRGYSTAVVGKWHLGLDWQLSKDGDDLEEYGLSEADHPVPERRFGRKGNFAAEDRWEVEGADIDYSQPISFGPNQLGFDYSFITAASHDQPPFVYIENGKALGIPTHFGGDQWRLDRLTDSQSTQTQRGPMTDDFDVKKLPQDFQDKTLEVLDQMLQGEDPWFLYVPSHLVHGPLLPGESWQGRSGLGPYGDFVLQFDEYVGQMVQAIDDAGQADNTIVIVTSDNGASPVAGFEHLRSHGHDPSNGWRGAKADIWEGGHREPFIVRWPALIEPNSTSDHLISHSDVFATLAEVLGETVPESAAVDSISQLAVWDGSSESTRTDIVSSSGGGGFAIRKGHWKLAFTSTSDGFGSTATQANGREPTRYEPAQLYDLSKDAGEEQNLIESEPGIVAELTELMGDYVRLGRSTQGTAQLNDAGTPADRWIQISWMPDADVVIAQTRK